MCIRDRAIIFIFILLCVISILLSSRIKFNFSFDQFFPEGDPDLEFYNQFKKDFEPDDNFLLIAIKNEPSVFDSSFLAKFHSLSIDIKSLSDVKSVQSLSLIHISSNPHSVRLSKITLRQKMPSLPSKTTSGNSINHKQNYNKSFKI